MEPCTPDLCTRPYSTQMRTLRSNLIKWISVDAMCNARWKFWLLIIQKNGSKWWINYSSVSLHRLVPWTLADIFVLFTMWAQVNPRTKIMQRHRAPCHGLSNVHVCLLLLYPTQLKWQKVTYCMCFISLLIKHIYLLNQMWLAPQHQ